MESEQKQLEYYRTLEGKVPFKDWLASLQDIRARARIDAKLAKVRLGNLGDSRSVGGGVLELEVDYGPGYRLYIGQHGSTLILLLCGGKKSTQSADIKKAIMYWQEYRERLKEERKCQK